MPITNGNYKNPGWNDGGPPAINAAELNAISNTLETGIPNASLNVGDILFTERVDLGEKYLLCNGDDVTDSKYSSLMPLLNNSTLSDRWESAWKLPNAPVNYRGFEFINGYYIIFGLTDTSVSSINDICVYYSTSLKGTWTYKKITSFSANKSFLGVYNIRYLNGRYFILYHCNVDGSTGQYESHLLYSTSLNGTWTDTKWWGDASTFGQNARYADIAYNAGQYVIARDTYDSNTGMSYTGSWYSTNLTAWNSSGSIWSGSDTNMKNLAYWNGRFMCTIGNVFYWKTSPVSGSGDWTGIGNLYATYNIPFITSENYYAIFGAKNADTSLYLYYLNTSMSETTINTGMVLSNSYSQRLGNYLNKQPVFIYNGAGDGNINIVYSSSVSSEFINGSSVYAVPNLPISNMYLTNTEWLIISYSGNNISFYIRKYNTKVLPKISLDTSYAMIRAIK